ncbi:MAG: protein translocase subunit SecD [Chloroflexi bacterium]|nr:protein translocase subunit SecD [Chloroflexota bacterium]
MISRPVRSIIFILIVFLGAVWVVLPSNPGVHFTLGKTSYDRDIKVHEGLDLQGGLQVLLEADLPAGQTPTGESMRTARDIVENRVNALGVTEPLVQQQGANRIVVELPGVQDPDQAIATLKQTGLLEFVDAQTTPLRVGAELQTDCVNPSLVDCGASTLPPATATPLSPTAAPTASQEPTTAATTTVSATEQAAATGVASPTPAASPTTQPTPAGPIYHTVMTGAAISRVGVSRNSSDNQIVVQFELTSDGARIFGNHTSTHIQQFLAIVLDKKVISSPVIQAAITSGKGVIQGSFTLDSANQLAIQLRYGSLPVPLKVVQSKTIGPTLGEDSIRKSAIAGAIGLAVVALFMLLYYRLPGFLADLALIVYAVSVFAIFKLIPVTLTLPGIAGFVLSVGVAVDANILIFERMKEELRGGRKLEQAVEVGHSRAWPSIRDSNISTLITCAILFWFGSTFGASIVKGFALTLAIGVGVSLFTALFVTRALLHLVLDRMNFAERHSWFGI